MLRVEDKTRRSRKGDLTMRFLTLYSGSGGNAAYFEVGGAKILIDAGKSCRTLVNSLHGVGVAVDDIDAIFITHEHSDHVSALETLTKKHKIPIHITKKSAERFADERYESIHECMITHEITFEVTLGDVRVRSFETPHDSRMSVGYRIDFSENGEEHSIGLATDIGYVTNTVAEALTGCEAVILESNHDIEMLKEGSYPADLKKRILSRGGHLSNPDSARFAAYLAEKGARKFILAHISAENNDPCIVLDEFMSAVADPTVMVAAAHPEFVTELV